MTKMTRRHIVWAERIRSQGVEELNALAAGDTPSPSITQRGPANRIGSTRHLPTPSNQDLVLQLAESGSQAASALTTYGFIVICLIALIWLVSSFAGCESW